MPEQASKGKSRTPTRLRYGEGRTSREATDTGTGSVRRGSGHGMAAKRDRGAAREAPPGGARHSAVRGKEGGPAGESDRAIVARKPGNAGGAKGPALRHASEAEEDEAIDRSLTTPEKIRKLQRKLYRKAKQEPSFRFYQLWDKVWRSDILEHAYRLAKANGGAAGVDGVTWEQIESPGREEWLRSRPEDLRSKT